MRFEDLLTLVGSQPLFETGLLLAGNADPDDMRRQLSRWARSGRIHQYRRGLYSLSPPYQKIAPHPFVAANALVTGSYVSKQSALAFYGLIPEYVPRTTSVTVLRPAQWEGGFQFQHIAPSLNFGYEAIDLPGGQSAFVATPEKALLDLAHLTPRADAGGYLEHLRLQNLERLNIDRLREFARRARKPKWERIANQVIALAAEETEHYEEVS